MRKNRIVRNAGAAAFQVVLSSLLMFVLYRYLVRTIGVEQLGIWSVVLATTAASRITELGLTGGVVRFVAKYLAQSDEQQASQVVQTAVISVGVFVGVLLIVAYLPSIWTLGHVLPRSAMGLAAQILPYALASLWITTLNGVFQSALDGCQRTDLRALFGVINSALTLLTAIMLVPKFGLPGLAYCQLGLAVAFLVANWCCLKFELKCLPAIPLRWQRPLFKEMIHYGANFQLISFITISFDPITKSLLSRYGDLSMVGYYEMASRMTTQFRALLSAPSQVLIPVVAGLQETEPRSILRVYQQSYRLQLFLSLPLHAGLIALLPEISRLLIGSYQPAFVLFSLLLAFGWFINGMTNPAYFTYMGTGKLKWNTVSSIVVGSLNILLGVILGRQFGGSGVVAGWTIALAVGSSLVIIAFHIDHGISFGEMLPREDIGLLIASAVGVAAVWLAHFEMPIDSAVIFTSTVGALMFLVAIAVPGWRHPMRSRLIGMIAGRGFV
jgi:O-antigen/teichoic acid export membrane protein